LIKLTKKGFKQNVIFVNKLMELVFNAHILIANLLFIWNVGDREIYLLSTKIITTISTVKNIGHCKLN